MMMICMTVVCHIRYENRSTDWDPKTDNRLLITLILSEHIFIEDNAPN